METKELEVGDQVKVLSGLDRRIGRLGIVTAVLEACYMVMIDNTDVSNFQRNQLQYFPNEEPMKKTCQGYAVGDRVMFTKHTTFAYMGEVGTVDLIDNPGYIGEFPVAITNSNGQIHWCNRDTYKKVEVEELPEEVYVSGIPGQLAGFVADWRKEGYDVCSGYTGNAVACPSLYIQFEQSGCTLTDNAREGTIPLLENWQKLLDRAAATKPKAFTIAGEKVAVKKDTVTIGCRKTLSKQYILQAVEALVQLNHKAASISHLSTTDGHQLSMNQLKELAKWLKQQKW